MTMLDPTQYRAHLVQAAVRDLGFPEDKAKKCSNKRLLRKFTEAGVDPLRPTRSKRKPYGVRSPLKKRLRVLIQEGQHTRDNLFAILAGEFPGKEVTITTYLSNVKNPDAKDRTLPQVAEVSDQGVYSFAEA